MLIKVQGNFDPHFAIYVEKEDDGLKVYVDKDIQGKGIVRLHVEYFYDTGAYTHKCVDDETAVPRILFTEIEQDAILNALHVVAACNLQMGFPVKGATLKAMGKDGLG